MWPGDDVVGAAGPDCYDRNLHPDGTGHDGAPVGIDRWVEFVVEEHAETYRTRARGF